MMQKVLPTAGRVLAAMLVVYAVVLGLGLFITRVAENSWPFSVEDSVDRNLAQHRTAELNDASYLFSGLGNTAAIVGALLVVAIALRLALHRWTESVFLVLAVSAQALIFFFTTLLIDRQRPHVHRLDDSPPTSSYPSGHTGAATALFVASALLVAIYLQRQWLKILSVTLLLVVPVLVAYGRLYRGMHHPSDVVVAILNGLACVAIAAVFVLGRGRRGDGALDPQPAPAEAVAR